MDKDKNFSDWYNWIIRESGIIDDRYPVKGSPVYRPYGFILFKNMMNILEKELEENGYLPSWFPIFIPEEIFRKEMEHILGFEKEAFYTEEENRKLFIRPTSETEMYYMYSLWIQSYKDLPLRLYMTNTVYRNETKATKPLIRGVEILWNEAHGAFKDMDNAYRDIKMSMEIYSKVYNTLHIPHIWVKRPDWDKFAGAEETYAADTILPDGKFLQIGTTHLLGRKFSKVFNIKFYDRNPFVKISNKEFEAYGKDGSYFRIYIDESKITIERYINNQIKEKFDINLEKKFEISEDNEEFINYLKSLFTRYFENIELINEKYVWQISFGLSMRTIAAMISILGDNIGLVLPSYVAPIQIVIIPIYYSEEEKEKVISYSRYLYKHLKDLGYRVLIDEDESKTPGWKFNYYEMIGVPIRIEIGLKETEKNSLTISIRKRNKKGERREIYLSDLDKELSLIIKEYEEDLENYSKEYFKDKIKKVNSLDEFEKEIGNGYVVKAPFCMRKECAESIKERYQAEVRGTDIEPEVSNEKCIFCGNDAKYYVYIGKSY